MLRPAWPELLGCYGLLACLALVLAGRPKPLAALLTSLALLVGPDQPFQTTEEFLASLDENLAAKLA